MNPTTYFVTGGAGFIGSCFVRRCFEQGNLRMVNFDKLTYAGHVESIPHPPPDRYQLIQGCVTSPSLVRDALADAQPDCVVHFAAESHVDRSIDGPDEFLQTNVVGTVNLLEQTLDYFRSLDDDAADRFRFLHVSTDEVHGSIEGVGRFTESSPHQPNSPYAASKAAAEMFVRSYRETFGLPTLITRCGNNYGPYQFPEKLIPLMILNAIESKRLPVYGDGMNIRDWLFVEDHCEAVMQVLQRGRVGEVYNIGGDNERTNVQIVQAICDRLDERLGRFGKASSRSLIQFVADRPGHDRRYAIDSSKIRSELGWRPRTTFEMGIRQTVDWYLEHSGWVQKVSSRGEIRQRRGSVRATRHDESSQIGNVPGFNEETTQSEI